MSDPGAAGSQPPQLPESDTPPQPAKKSAAKKSTAKKTASSTKKSAAKKTTASATPPAKKAAAKKAAPKKTVAKQPAAKKTAAKKPTSTTAAKQAVPASAGASPETDAQPPQPPVATPADEAPADAPRRFPPKDDVPRPWLESYPPLVPQSYPYPDVAFTRLLDDAAKDFPDSIALNFLGRPLTYRRLSEQVDRFATALSGLGVKPGDRVGLALPNCPQHVVAFHAVLRLGATVVEIDPDVDDAGLQTRVNDTGCRVLVVLDPVYAKLERLKGRVPTVEHVVGTAIADYLPPVAANVFTFRHRNDERLVHKIPPSEGVLRFIDLMRRSTPSATQHPVAPADDVAVVVYPADGPAGGRGVALTHRNLLTNVFQIRLWIPDVQAGRETILCAIPFWQPYGLLAGMGLGVLSAANLALLPSVHRDDLLTVIGKRTPTLFPATAPVIEAIASAPQLRKLDLTSIRVALCDTSLLSADVVSTFEDATGARLREGLGIAELSGLSLANPVYGKAKPDRVGLPLSDTACVLIDLEDRSHIVESGTRGELAVRGPQVMKGYWQRPDETARVLVDGWLRTGLLAEVDDEGYFCILGRVPEAETARTG